MQLFFRLKLGFKRFLSISQFPNIDNNTVLIKQRVASSLQHSFPDSKFDNINFKLFTLKSLFIFNKDVFPDFHSEVYVLIVLRVTWNSTLLRLAYQT